MTEKEKQVALEDTGGNPKDEKEASPEYVVLTKASFNNTSIYQKRTDTVEVPELNALMQLESPQVAVLEIQQLTLGELLHARGDQNDLIRNLVEGVVAAAAKKEELKDEVLELWDKMTSEEQYRVIMLQKGVVNPKLSRSDAVFITKLFANVAIRVCAAIVTLTDQGASLKKNSIG